MAPLTPPLERANGLLRLHRLSLRIRQRRHSQWLSVYELGSGGPNREKAMRGYAAADPAAVDRLCEQVLRLARPGEPFPWDALTSTTSSASRASTTPCWPEICEAVVAFQRGQGVNMNLVGPFKGSGYFRLLPTERPATLEDVRRFALHTSESLKAHLEDRSEPLLPMATHRQGFRQKREVVSLLRRAGFAAIAPEELSSELKGLVNRKKQALVAASSVPWSGVTREEQPRRSRG
jgi:hypothetical protein